MQSPSSTTSTPRWHKIAFWIIPAITVLVLGMIIGSNLDNIRDLFVAEEEPLLEDDLFIGKEVKVTGLLEQSPDFRVHTHTLLSDEYDLLGLRSESLNLSAYQGRSVIRGTVKEYYDGKYVIEVSAAEKSDVQEGLLSGDVLGEEIDDDFIYEIDQEAQRFFPEAGLLFDVEGDRGYVASMDKGSVILSSLTGSDEVRVNYFACKDGDPNHDCNALSERFENAAEYKVVSANGYTYYKLPETDSRYVRNGDLFGYFINGAQRDTIEGLTKYIILPNKQYVENEVMQYAPELCTTADANLDRVDSFDVQSTHTALTVTIVGSDIDEREVTCVLTIDLTSDLGASLSSLTVDGENVDVDSLAEEDDNDTDTTLKDNDDDVGSEQQDETDDENDTPKSYDQEQITLTPENPYIFESSRGHKIIFPSRNITFAPGTEKKNIGLDGVDCYTYTDLTTYNSDETLHSDPAVQLFECAIADGTTSFGDYRRVSSADGKQFLIKALKPSRQQFVDEIEIE